MEKRYQVFISSTYQDLQGARQEVSQALLRADCFPAGMELFPAADEEQFEFIKTVIDQSDYYIIISAGRYGSIHPETGLSYTEMEYDYAVEIGKPVIRLLHKNPFNALKGEFIENSDAGREALERFRDKMRASKLVRFWEIPKELGIEVLVSLSDLKRRNDAIGWVRADKAIDAGEALEISRLRKRVAELEDQQGNTVYTFDDETANHIKKCFREIFGENSTGLNVYRNLLQCVADNEDPLEMVPSAWMKEANQLLGVLLATGSLMSSKNGIDLSERSWADFGFATT